MRQISILWARRLESGDKKYNFNDVPAQLKDEVLQKLHEDGYTVNDERYAVLAADNQ